MSTKGSKHLPLEDITQLAPARIKKAVRWRGRRLSVGQAKGEGVRFWGQAMDVLRLGQGLGVVWVGAGEVEDAIQSLVRRVPAVAADNRRGCIVVDIVEKRCHEQLVHLDGGREGRDVSSGGGNAAAEHAASVQLGKQGNTV